VCAKRAMSTNILLIPAPVVTFSLGTNLMIPCTTPSPVAGRRKRGSVFLPRENTKDVQEINRSLADLGEGNTESVFDQKKEIDVLWKKLLVSIPRITKNTPKKAPSNNFSKSQPGLLGSMTVTDPADKSREPTSEISFSVSDVSDSQSEKSAP
jgi:hypothetical protein